MFKFKGNLITKWKRYCRWKKIHGFAPLTRERVMDLNPGDRVLMIKRNETQDVIALSCGIDGTQPANELGEWYVAKKNKSSILIKSVRGENKAVLDPKFSMFQGFNLIIVRPHMFSERFELRAYYKRL